MKDILESSETFDAYAQVDYNYWLLRKFNKDLKNKKPIDNLIDDTTGYTKVQCEYVASIIEEIIYLKESLEIDQTEEKEELAKFKQSFA